MPINYCTLYQLRSELGLGADETGDDKLLSRLLARGSRWIDQQQLRRHFDPRRETRRFDDMVGFDPFNFNSWIAAGYARGILLDAELLEIVTLTDGAAGPVDPGQYYLHSPNFTPYWGVSLRLSANSLWQPDAAGNYEQALALDGVWGYHTRYADAWPRTLDTVVDNPLTDVSTAIHVADADGPAEDSDDPRFQAGNLIRLGPAGATAEYAQVRAVDLDDAGDSLTVVRGVNGTTAAAWPAGTPIYVFRPAEEIQGALIRLATWLYRMKDVTFFERVSILGSTQKVAQGAVPDDVLDLLPAPPLVIR